MNGRGPSKRNGSRSDEDSSILSRRTRSQGKLKQNDNNEFPDPTIGGPSKEQSKLYNDSMVLYSSEINSAYRNTSVRSAKGGIYQGMLEDIPYYDKKGPQYDQKDSSPIINLTYPHTDSDSGYITSSQPVHAHPVIDEFQRERLWQRIRVPRDIILHWAFLRWERKNSKGHLLEAIIFCPLDDQDLGCDTEFLTIEDYVVHMSHHIRPFICTGGCHRSKQREVDCKSFGSLAQVISHQIPSSAFRKLELKKFLLYEGRDFRFKTEEEILEEFHYLRLSKYRLTPNPEISVWGLVRLIANRHARSGMSEAQVRRKLSYRFLFAPPPSRLQFDGREFHYYDLPDGKEIHYHGSLDPIHFKPENKAISEIQTNVIHESDDTDDDGEGNIQMKDVKITTGEDLSHNLENQSIHSVKSEEEHPETCKGRCSTQTPTQTLEGQSPVPIKDQNGSQREIPNVDISEFDKAIIDKTSITLRAYVVQRALQAIGQRLLGKQSDRPRDIVAHKQNPVNDSLEGNGEGSTSQTSSNAPGSASRVLTRGAKRQKQLTKGKARSEGNDGDGNDDEDSDSHRKKRSRADKNDPALPPVRFACTFFANALSFEGEDMSSENLDLTKWATACYRSGFETIARLKDHLYSHHLYGCQRCNQILPNAEAFFEHQGCDELPGNPTQCLSRDQVKSFKSKVRIAGIDTEEKRWAWIYRIVFPEVAEDKVPSPYWQAISLSLKCNKQHVDSWAQRNALFALIKEQFETSVNARELSDPLVKALLKILRNVWNNIIDNVMEKIPITSQESGRVDVEAWKSIFTDVTNSSTSEGDDDEDANSIEKNPHPPTGEDDFDLIFGGTEDGHVLDMALSHSTPLTTRVPVLPASLSGVDSARLEALKVPVQQWKFNPQTGDRLDGDLTYFDDTMWMEPIS